jgi:hypothetical protein
VAWAVRIGMCLLVVGGAYHLLLGLILLGTGPSIPAAIVTAAGLVALTVGWIVGIKAAAAIHRHNAERPDRDGIGFDVVPPADRHHQP